MDQAVDGRDGHGLVREDLIPSAERLVGGDGDRCGIHSVGQLGSGPINMLDRPLAA